MKCIEDLKAKAAEYGATVDECGLPHFINIDTPAGYVWNYTECTTIVVIGSNGSQSWWAEACRDAAAEMAYGRRLVTDPQELSDIRWSLDEDDWGRGVVADDVDTKASQYLAAK